MRFPVLATCLLATCLLALALPAGADALLQKAKAKKPSDGAPVYTYSVDYHDGKALYRLSVDQSRPEGERLVGFSPDPATLTGDAAKRYERLKATTSGDIWCRAFSESIPADARRVSETGGRAAYEFTPLPGANAGDMGKQYKHLKGRAEIDTQTGEIMAFEMTAPKAFKPAVVAKVDRFEMKIACALAPDGRSHIETMTMDLSGTAMMNAFSQTERRSVSKLTPVTDAGFGAP